MRNLLSLVFLAQVVLPLSAWAWIYVPDKGETGWQTYVYTAGPEGFSGTAGFVVSNVIDSSAYSELLLDNLSQCGDGINNGFEVGNYTSYTLLGESYGEVTDKVISESGVEYVPTQGEYMSHQYALACGINTSHFTNAEGQAGTVGSILETAISLKPGERFTFDWAFLGRDSSPWNDFALFYLKDSSGTSVFTDGLAQIRAPTPPRRMPASVILLLLN